MNKLMRLDIVSAEKKIFNGDVQMVSVTGDMGEMSIAPGHAQLLTKLKPGYISAMNADAIEEVFYVSGGMLEVQPDIVSVLADTAMRASDIDEIAAITAKAAAEKVLAGKTNALDMAKANADLAEIAAQIRAVSRLKQQAHGNRS